MVRKQTTLTATVTFLLLCSAVVAGASAVTARPAAETSPHGNGVGANYTVVFPSASDHQPGTSGASIQHLSAAGDSFEGTSSPQGLKVLEFIKIYSDDIDFSQCTTENTRAFGIDRGNDDSGTTTDEGLLRHRKDSQFNKNSIIVEFYKKDALAGSSTHFNSSDQIVAVQDGCYGMPDKPGWYQINARVNGTGYNGNHIDSAEKGTIRTHYFWVCDCQSESEARKKLGPPPSESGSGDGSSGDGGSADGGDGGASTPTATTTPSSGDGGSGGGGSGDGGAGGSGDGASGDTQTTTAPSGGSSGDGGAGDGGAGDGGAGTSTTTDDGQTATGNSTATSSATGGSGDGGDGGDGATTPTSGGGPGFGVLAALVALTGAALAATRRSN